MNEVPPFTNAKEGKRGGRTIRCPCDARHANKKLAYECQNRAIFVRLCSLCAPRCLFAGHFLFANFARFSRDFTYYYFGCSKICSSAISVFGDVCIGDAALLGA